GSCASNVCSAVAKARSIPSRAMSWAVRREPEAACPAACTPLKAPAFNASTTSPPFPCRPLPPGALLTEFDHLFHARSHAHAPVNPDQQPFYVRQTFQELQALLHAHHGHGGCQGVRLSARGSHYRNAGELLLR